MNADDPEHKHLTISERLAMQRTLLAADRSLLAWVRTSLALIGFGFTIYKVLQALVAAQPPESPLGPQTPRNLGLFLILLGTVPLALSMMNYRRLWLRLHCHVAVAAPKLLMDPGFLAAAVVVLLGRALTGLVLFGGVTV